MFPHRDEGHCHNCRIEMEILEQWQVSVGRMNSEKT